jgi:hypothetical protein
MLVYAWYEARQGLAMIRAIGAVHSAEVAGLGYPALAR